jgi:hypothetical protein
MVISSPAAIVVTLAVTLVVSFVVPSGRNQPSEVGGVSWPRLTLGPADRLLILAPHPDDDVGSAQSGTERGRTLKSSLE